MSINIAYASLCVYLNMLYTAVRVTAVRMHVLGKLNANATHTHTHTHTHTYTYTYTCIHTYMHNIKYTANTVV